MKSLARIRKRQGRCYELAAIAMLRESDSDRWKLVHGRLSLGIMLSGVDHPADVFDLTWERARPEQRTNLLYGWLDHAWVELDDGRVYDSTLNDYWRADHYLARWGAVVDHRYTRAEMIRLYNVARHTGPWTDDERRKAKALREAI